jgi:hypothetical protein
MKKLRMIVTAVVVLVIVGSAFAFKSKIGVFCVLDSTKAGTNCTTIIITEKKTTTSGGILWKYYPSFDGDKTACIVAGNGKCTATVRLINN